MSLCPAAILRCDHSNEILTIVFAHGSVCFAAYSKLYFYYILIWRSFEKRRARGGRKEEGVVCIQIMHRRGFVSSRKTAMTWKRRDADIKRKQTVNETIETITSIQFLNSYGKKVMNNKQPQKPQSVRFPFNYSTYSNQECLSFDRLQIRKYRDEAINETLKFYGKYC